MLENSQDVLNLVIAFCVLWFTVFVCWTIYYFGMILKRINTVTEALTDVLEAAKDFMDKTKERINSVGATLGAIVQLGEQAISYFSSKKSDKKGKK